jgi:hypothetical protein
MPVVPRPVKCGAKLPDGGKCDQHALVTNARYIYNRKPAIDSDRDDPILVEIHYSALCPVCGERMLIEQQ